MIDWNLLIIIGVFLLIAIIAGLLRIVFSGIYIILKVIWFLLRIIFAILFWIVGKISGRA